MMIAKIERFYLDIPFRGAVHPWCMLLVRNWRVREVVKVTTDSGVIGWGESLPHYTWQAVTDLSVAAAIGKPLIELWHSDEIGAGLQMAVGDALGKCLGVPMWQLFGLPKLRERAMIGWWCTKMPPEVLASEAKTAVASGYTAIKIKTRPWFDVYESIRQIDLATPENFHIDADFNDMLLTANQAVSVLRELDNYEKIALYEGPIPQRDVDGYRLLRSKVERPIAAHFGTPDFRLALDSVDGFVVDSGIRETLRRGRLAEAFEKPFFLQMLGGGLMTAQMAHLSAVLAFARWPAITCRNLWTDDLVTTPMPVLNGTIAVPDAPGLGVEFDESALEKYTLRPPYAIALPPQILTIRWANGVKAHYPFMERPRVSAPHFSHARMDAGDSSATGVWEDALRGNLPYFPRGVNLTVRDDDGSKDFADLRARCLIQPVWE
jgi:L-alanine-DL-glutamate epimerase-like enolase superfamily enzyme